MSGLPRPTLLSTAHLNYLQRSDLHPADLSDRASLTSAPPSLRRLWRIHGIGRDQKAPVRQPEGSVRLLSEDILIGLYGYKIPLAFLVEAEPGGVAIHLGTWSPATRENASAATLDARQQIVNTVLSSLYPATELARADIVLPSYQRAGLALGVPTATSPDLFDGAMPLDRLIRAMAGSRWACLILAEPVNEPSSGEIRDQVLTEIRAVEAGAEATMAPSPLGKHYTELLDVMLKSLTIGQAVGTWRAGVYLLGDGESYYRLASTWRGVFSGEQSLPEPVRVRDSREAPELAHEWAMADEPGAQGPGFYRHPFQYQTLLTSSQLAAYVHLPQLETSGFSVKVVPRFDVVPATDSDECGLSVGRVIHRAHVTQIDYAVSLKSLSRHAFIPGVTGAGKTNTIFHLLQQATASDVPFLVIEPAKTEYRTLLNDPDLGTRLRVYTPGNENVSPFRLNPFEVLPGTPVSVHLDLLRSLFSASFGMWTPLPQILERCLHQIYEDRGWDLTTNTNRRVDAETDMAAAFPTLSDLVTKVEDVTTELGYEERVTADLRAALRTRLDSLRTGGKGRMLDVRRSLPMMALLEHPTILELEGMGDDDDVAFIMGLLVIRLVEHRRAAGELDGLQHLLVVEEAHRLLTNVRPGGREEEANPQGKAVETFANLLAEIRAYGQGVIIADQVPVSLAPTVIKNTQLKIAHRVVAQDDRAVLAGAMAMNEQQMHSLAVLGLGEAAVFTEGDDAPILVKVPRAKGVAGQNWPDDRSVAERMTAVREQAGYQSLLLPFPECGETGKPAGSACDDAARGIVEDVAFQRTLARVVLSTIEDADALDRLWPDLLAVIQSRRPPVIDEARLFRCLLTRGAHWFAERRGAQASWSYSQTHQLAARLQQALLAKLASASPEPERAEFRHYAHHLSARTYDPFPACSQVCTQQPPICLYRYNVSDLVVRGTHREAWYAADEKDALSETGTREQTWEVCLDGGYELIEFPEDGWTADLQRSVSEAARRTCLCFAQHMLDEDLRKTPRTVRRIMDKILAEASQ